MILICRFIYENQWRAWCIKLYIYIYIYDSICDVCLFASVIIIVDNEVKDLVVVLNIKFMWMSEFF